MACLRSPLLLPVLLLSAVSVSALPDFTNWAPAGPGDARSPCPGLNSLANHGILPRDGNGLTVPVLREALVGAYNLDHELSTILAVGGLLTTPHPLSGKFNLDDLNVHAGLEHDASLSRADFFAGGDDHSFNQTIFDSYMAHYAGSDKTTLRASSKARLERISTEAARDPTFLFGPKQSFLSYGELLLHLSVLGDPTTAIAPVKYIKILFEQERIPYNEGWRTPSTQITVGSAVTMIPRLAKAGGDVLPEAELISANTLARAFLGLDPKSGFLSKLQDDVLRKFNVNLD